MNIDKSHSFDLLNYITNDENQDAEYYDLLSYELKKCFFQYGEHFKSSQNSAISSEYRFYKTYLFEFGYYLFRKAMDALGAIPQNNINIISSSIRPFDSKLESAGFQVYRAPWAISRSAPMLDDLFLFQLTKKLEKKLSSVSFRDLLSEEFLALVKEYEQALTAAVVKLDIQAIMLPADIGFFSRISIKVFSALNRKTIFLAHGGIPTFYDGIMDNRTDYIVLWGQRQVDAYIEMGFEPSKLFVSGHPTYHKRPGTLAFSLEAPLVLSKAVNGVCPLENMLIEDRSRAILYLCMVQKTLQNLGVEKARLRPHPSENNNWYSSCVDTNFYELDDDTFGDSIAKASVVIGPASTSLIDVLNRSVNYVVFEPMNEENETIMGYPLCPPIDGKDSRVPVAQSERELLNLLESKTSIDPTVYEEFAPINCSLDFLKELVS